MSPVYRYCVKGGEDTEPDNCPVCEEHLAPAIRAEQDQGRTVLDRDGRVLLPGRAYRYCGVCGGDKAEDTTWVHEDCLSHAWVGHPSGLNPEQASQALQIAASLRAMRDSVEPKTNANPTYHALSMAISALTRATEATTR